MVARNVIRRQEDGKYEFVGNAEVERRGKRPIKETNRLSCTLLSFLSSSSSSTLTSSLFSTSSSTPSFSSIKSEYITNGDDNKANNIKDPNHNENDKEQQKELIKNDDYQYQPLHINKWILQLK